MEGVVAKRLNSPYLPGRRSPDWVKIKNVRAQDVVIGGWKPGAGRRAGMIGALLLGIPSQNSLDYVGKVGTGFTDAMLRDLAEEPGTAEGDVSLDGPRTGWRNCAVTESLWVADLVRSKMRFTAAAAAAFAEPGAYPPLPTVLLDLAQALDHTADVMGAADRCPRVIAQMRTAADEARAEIIRLFEQAAVSGGVFCGAAARTN